MTLDLLLFTTFVDLVVSGLQEVCDPSVTFSWSNIDFRTLLASPDETLEPAWTIVLLLKEIKTVSLITAKKT